MARPLRNSPAFAAAAFLTMLSGSAWAGMSTAVRATPHQVAGLQNDAQIIVDFWGIPHIYAANDHDALFLQGYNAARDRLWQIDLWRKRGLGLLARDFGPSYVAQDRAARMFLYRGDMTKEWASYGPNASASPKLCRGRQCLRARNPGRHAEAAA